VEQEYEDIHQCNCRKCKVCYKSFSEADKQCSCELVCLKCTIWECDFCKIKYCGDCSILQGESPNTKRICGTCCDKR
jgi:hypothetical protein